jgi:hypothetical protein
VSSLTAKDGHDRPLFDKLLWCLVSSPIFVLYQHLTARKIAELFSSNHAMSQFYEACSINDVRRGSVLCLFAASFATGRKNCSFAKTARRSVAANSDITILSILAAM